MSALTRLLCLLTFAVLLSGCGVKTAYNNADWLLMRSINDRISLSDDQEREVRAVLEDSLAWHCASELPDYAAFLRRVDHDIAADRIDQRTIEAYGEQIERFGERLLVRLRPKLIELMADLDDEQVVELMAGFEERNDELVEEAERYASEEAVGERAEGLEKGIRRFSGRLTGPQRERVTAWAEGLRPTAELTLQRRLRWQAEFLRVMALREDRGRFDPAISELLRPGGFISAELERRREQNRIHTIDSMVDIHRLAPERQIDELRDNLADFSEDLEQLSCSS